MPNLRDVAQRAVVMGECWICAGLIPCDDPDRCGYGVGSGNGPAE